MNAKRVVLTGATGFIGSHIADDLVAQGYELIALKRRRSSMRRVESIASSVRWINVDEAGWEQQVQALRPNYLVHAAWLGVGVEQRDDWSGQLENLSFTYKLLNAVASNDLLKVIVLGSQAEYGAFEGRIDEGYSPKPTMAYGAVKLATCELVKAFCEEKSIEWYWLRVFAVFGPREDAHWFVSFVAKCLLKQETANLTACAQRYDYLFVRDLAKGIVQTLPAEYGKSGIYNICSNQTIKLSNIVDELKNIIGSSSLVNYGAIPYRPSQVMHMEGNADKFYRAFGFFAHTPLQSALLATVDYVRQETQADA